MKTAVIGNSLALITKRGKVVRSCRLGACTSLLSYSKPIYYGTSRYSYRTEIYWFGIKLGTTEYRPVTIGDNAYTYTDSIPYVTHLQ